MSYNSLFGLASHSADANIEGWWILQESTGTTAADSSGNARTGTINNMGANPVTATGPNSWLTSAFHFDGANQNVEVSNAFADLYTNDEFTVGFRVYFDGGSLAADERLIHIGSGATSAVLVWMDTDGSGDGFALSSRYAAGTVTTIGQDSTNASLATWQDIVATKTNAEALEIVVDGVSGATGTAGGNLYDPTTTILTIASRSAAEYAEAYMCDVFVFSRDLSSSEQAEWRAGPEPENTVAPTVSGDTAQGSTLTCSPGTWALPSPFSGGTNGTVTYTYQWTRDGGDISGATSSTYVTQVADVGTAVGCKVLGVNDGGSDTAEQTASSNTISVVASGPTYRMNMQLFIPTQV